MIDIVIQGGMWRGTVDTARHYVDHELVDRVIISTWMDEGVSQADIDTDKIVLLKNEKPDYIGPGNLNLHLLSSKNGLEQCTTDVVLKVRSDERISHEGITQWLQFFEDHDDGNTLHYSDGTKQKSKICVISTNINFPYHPQDHVFVGYQEDLRRLFNMPFSHEPPLMPEPIDFTVATSHLRNPIYIGTNYFAIFFEGSRHHLLNWKEYLLDDAPNRQEAMDFYLLRRNSIFRPMPVIDMWWEKFNGQYWWNEYAQSGDRYHEEETQ